MKKFVSLLVIALLLCVMCVPATAATTGASAAQYSSTKLFLQYLDAKDVNYTYVGIDGNGYEKVNVPNRDSDLGISYTISYFFDSNNENASIRVWDLVTFEEENMVYAMVACNSCHLDWKYVTFMVEADNTITAKMDLIYRGGSVDEVCWEATLHVVNVIAAAYPVYLGELAK